MTPEEVDRFNGDYSAAADLLAYRPHRARALCDRALEALAGLEGGGRAEIFRGQFLRLRSEALAAGRTRRR